MSKYQMSRLLLRLLLLIVMAVCLGFVGLAPAFSAKEKFNFLPASIIKPFLIERGGSFKMEIDGRLFLGINSAFYQEGSGTLDVLVHRTRTGDCFGLN